MTINEKLAKLREIMNKNAIDTYIISKNDPHQSENCKNYWNMVNFISGFSGSAGMVVVTADRAVLWTDGRYSIQAENELLETDFEIYNTSDPAVKDIFTFAALETKTGGTIGFDGRTLSAKEVGILKNKISLKNIKLNTGLDLGGEIWLDRAVPTEHKIFEHPIQYAGVDRKDKVEMVKSSVKALDGDAYIISSIDDIAWLFNLRCNDCDTTVTFECYAYISETKTVLFAHSHKISDVKDVVEKDGIRVLDYTAAEKWIADELHGFKGNVLIDPGKTSFSLFSVIQSLNIINLECDITTRLKAVKNPVEIKNNRNTHIKDGAVVAKFIKWIKENAGKTPITEYTAGIKLNKMREEIETFVCLSFNTICGFAGNAAINHYRANEETALPITDQGFLLVDSGGNYLDGTTDITRTIVLGEITDEMKEDFTLVLKCHIGLAAAKFVYGTTGSNIDCMARRPLWERCKDFKHGTGHGIGFFLNCHEGPHRIAPAQNSTPLIPGMLVSNEPGFYKKGEYGIRSENIILVKKHSKNEFGQFLEFETITFCPFDLDAVLPELLTDSEKQWLNNYHKEVYEKLSPYMDEEEKIWLKNATRSLI